MCGIAGIYERDRPARPAVVSSLLSAIEHRGPDGGGVFAEGGVALGNRRLAILDLSSRAAQPMRWGERYVITYNGEIYNYRVLREELRRTGARFRSEADTEVVAAAYAHWGAGCLARFNGMFAFAIYDRLDRTLFCARDRLGVKPFNYVWDGRRLAFASEHKALLRAGLASPAVCREALYEYIARGYKQPDRSFFEDIIPLPPGHAMTFGGDGPPRSWRWWSPELQPGDGLTVEQRSEQLAALIDDAVQLRLRSDVPVGAHLSGGLDSSAVTASAARAVGRGLVTFTGAFPSDPEGDERRFARSLAERYGLRAHEAEISIGSLSDAFDRILWHLDEPVAGPGVFPQLVVCDLTARQGVKVVLVGHGGDELFGGYLRHRLVHYKRMAASGGPVRRMRAARELVLLALQNAARARRTATRVSDANLAPGFLAGVDAGFRDHVRRSSLASGSASELMLWDLSAYLPSLLQVEDRVSMAASLESRTPLLDHRLVEAALAIPEDALFAPGEPKPALRSAVAAWLPTEITARRDKRGFPTPLQQWKRSPSLRGLVKRLTAEIDRDEMSVFSPEYLGRRERFSPSELWTVITIQGWLRMFSSANLAPREATHAQARPCESHRSA